MQVRVFNCRSWSIPKTITGARPRILCVGTWGLGLGEQGGIRKRGRWIVYTYLWERPWLMVSLARASYVAYHCARALARCISLSDLLNFCCLSESTLDRIRLTFSFPRFLSQVCLSCCQRKHKSLGYCLPGFKPRPSRAWKCKTEKTGIWIHVWWKLWCVQDGHWKKLQSPRTDSWKSRNEGLRNGTIY